MGHRYQLVFNGQFKAGVTRQACIKRLAKRMQRDPEVIARRFFDQPPTVVLSTDNAASVDKAIKLFRRAGALLELRDESAGTPAAAATAANPPARRRRRRWPGMAIAALAGLAAVAIWYTLPLWHSSEHPRLEAVEAALATENLALLGHVDARRILTLEQRFFGDQDPGALPGSSAGAFVQGLLEAGIEPRAAVDLVLVGGYVESSRPWGAAVILGRFDPAPIRVFLESHFETAPQPAAAEVIHFTMVNEQTCARSGLMAAHVSESRILVAPARHLNDLAARMRDSARAQIPLKAWREFRAARLASVGILAPGPVLDAGASMAGPVLSRQALEPLEGAYLGLTATVMPPGIAISGAVNSTRDAFLDDHRQRLEEGLASFREHSPKEVSKLFDAVTVYRDEHQLGARVLLDRHFREDVEAMIQAGLGAVFMPATGTTAADTAMAPAERIEESPVMFRDNHDPATLPAFTAIKDANFPVHWSDGPFGLRVQEVGAPLAPGGSPYLELEAQGRELVNVSDNGQWGRLQVTGVIDGSGKSIMPRQDCGPHRNQEPAFLTSSGRGMYFHDGELVNYRKHTARKRIQLAHGTQLADVARIRGFVEADIPVRTERRTLEAPFAGQSLEAAGARIAFASGGDTTLRYETSGAVDRILAVRALNAHNQVLKPAGAMTMGRILGEGKVHSRDFHGMPARVEVIFASELQRLRREFTLHETYPRQAGDTALAPLPLATRRAIADQALAQPLPESAGDFYTQPRARTRSGPVQVAVERLQTGGLFGAGVFLNLRTGLLPGLDRNQAAGRIELHRARYHSGREQALDLSTRFGLERDGSIINGTYTPRSDKRHLEGSAHLALDSEDAAGLTTLEGTVELNLPLGIDRHKIDDLEFGQSYSAGGVTLAATELRRGSLLLRIMEGRDRIAAIEVFRADGSRVDSQIQMETAGDGWNARIGVGGTPAALTLHTVTESSQRRYPFTLDLE